MRIHFALPRRLVAAALGIVLVGCSTSSQKPRDPRGQEPTPGQGVSISFAETPVPLPDFTLTDLDGHTIDRAKWAGTVVVLNFWATWCVPCREEIPDLVALQERYRGSVVVVGMSVDEGPAADVRSFVQGEHINYPVSIVSGDIQDQFGGIGTVPSTFIVNPDGKVTQRHIGLVNAPQLEQEVRALAGFPTLATTTWDPALGEKLLTSAKYATEIPGVDLSGLSAAGKAAALKQLNTDRCTCGCGLTVAQCRIEDPVCTTSPGLAAAIVTRNKAS